MSNLQSLIAAAGVTKADLVLNNAKILNVFTKELEEGDVAGTDGISYMIESSKGLPLDIFFMLPSCVPPTPHDESGSEVSKKIGIQSDDISSASIISNSFILT